MSKNNQGNYASINGLKMYYEIHGTGRPLVLLHGGLMTIDSIGPLLPALAQSRQVIAVELEGHGRTADLDRPLHSAQMAEDIAALMRHLGLQQTDIFGFSLGGTTALGIGSRYPELVRKLVIVSTPYDNGGYYPSIVASWPSMSADGLVGTPLEEQYRTVAPNPDRWPVLIDKMKNALMSFEGWTPDEIRSIKAPTLLAIGDADLIRPEHAVETFRLLGGARDDGGMTGMPESQFAIIPGANHFTILTRVDVLTPITTSFLDAPLSAAG